MEINSNTEKETDKDVEDSKKAENVDTTVSNDDERKNDNSKQE